MDYEFIRDSEINSNAYLNFIINKRKINIGGADVRLLTEIKIRHLLSEEIYRKTKINISSNDHITFREAFSVPLKLRFYNRIFTLNSYNQNLNNIPKAQTPMQNLQSFNNDIPL